MVQEGVLLPDRTRFHPVPILLRRNSIYGFVYRGQATELLTKPSWEIFTVIVQRKVYSALSGEKYFLLRETKLYYTICFIKWNSWPNLTNLDVGIWRKWKNLVFFEIGTANDWTGYKTKQAFGETQNLYFLAGIIFLKLFTFIYKN